MAIGDWTTYGTGERIGQQQKSLTEHVDPLQYSALQLQNHWEQNHKPDEAQHATQTLGFPHVIPHLQPY